MRFVSPLSAAAALAVSFGTAVAASALPLDVRGMAASLAARTVGSVPPDPEARSPVEIANTNPHNFYFARAQYSDDGVFPDWKDWRTDFPKADRQFLSVLRRLARLDAHEGELSVRLSDPGLRRFPYIYAVEVGHMQLTDAEVKGLREYLLAGGFLVVDDFWGTREWRSFARQMKRVLPEHSIQPIPIDHPLFHTYYDIETVVQVPNVGQGVAGGPTHESDGYKAEVHGIFDRNGRLMVAINWNTDLGDAWEWAEHPQYPLHFSTYAYQIGVNFIVYAMSH